MLLDLKRLIIPNWFSRQDLERLTGCIITAQKFQEFKTYIENKTNLSDVVSEQMRELFLENWEGKE